MGLGAFTDEQLARMFVEAENAEDWDAADRYELEFFNRRNSRFAGDKYDNEDAFAVWLKLRRDAGEIE